MKHLAADHRTRAWRWWEDYGNGITDHADPRLVPVPSIPGKGCLLHWSAAAVFRALAGDWLLEHPSSPGLLVTSGWRPRKPWQATPEAYRAELLRRYRPRMLGASDDDVIRHGKLYLAYRSAHFTGLALDLGSPPPMRADSRWVDTQRKSNVYDWLMAHAPDRGLRCYLPEPWHWELPLSPEVYPMAGPED
jgi:hypothetical protein